MFTVTKEMLDNWFNQGLTTQEVANAITTASGKKCTVGNVKKFAKHYNINLRTKPRKSGFMVESIDVVSTNIVELTKEEDVEANTVNIATTGVVNELDEFMDQPATIETL